MKSSFRTKYYDVLKLEKYCFFFQKDVSLSNNEEMISKLRATGGAGFDLAQPSQDRIAGPQKEFEIYKPLDLSKLKNELFIPSMLDATKGNTTVDGKVYGLPHIWGTDGLVVNTKLAQMANYTDLCKAEFKGKVAYRLKRPTLLAFAFASGKNPFALYNDPKAYGALMDEVGKTLTACKPNVKFYWDNNTQECCMLSVILSTCPVLSPQMRRLQKSKTN